MIVRIMGGLGNQLFQYALSRRIELKNGKTILFDIDTESAVTKRKYEIKGFQIQKYPTISKIKSRKYSIFRNNKKYKWSCLYGKIIRYGVEKKNFCYQDNLIYDYLDGYWQNMDYFSDIYGVLKNEIVYDYNRSVKQAEIENIINISNSVAIHVRRGDYLSSTNKQIYVLQDYYYYKKAVDLLCKKLYKPVFFVFSDDIEWCKESFNTFPNLVFIDSSVNHKSIEDFDMMRQCKHHIISNSTFSWWSSWLSNKDNKIIISPSRWYQDDKTNNDCINALMKDCILI